MRITNDIKDFIAKKVEAKIAPVSIEQDFEAAKAVAEQFGRDLSDKLNDIANKDFEDFLKLHPELANSSLTSPINNYHKFYIAYSGSEICKEYREQIELRKEYVTEVIQRVCIDATSCKDTEELLALIDRIVK